MSEKSERGRAWIDLQAYSSRGPDLLENAEVGTAIAYKVVAVVGGSRDWTAYWGPPGETNEYIASHGDKIAKEAAEALFPTFKHMGFRYRH